MSRLCASRWALRAAAALASLGLAPSVAHATDTAIRTGELMLEAWDGKLDLTWATSCFDLTCAPLPNGRRPPEHVFSFAARVDTAAEGVRFGVGARPILARNSWYRLNWVTELGPAFYGRDGLSAGAGAAMQLQSVFSPIPFIRLLATPKVDVLAAAGSTTDYKVTPSLVLGASLGGDGFFPSLWFTGDLGYSFSSRGAGSFALSATAGLAFKITDHWAPPRPQPKSIEPRDKPSEQPQKKPLQKAVELPRMGPGVVPAKPAQAPPPPAAP
jgi:hypothetical protein